MIVLKRLIDELFTLKWLCFIIPSFIFGWVSRQGVIQGTFMLQKESNQWDIMLAQLSDPYFLLYIFLPFMMLLSCLTIRDIWEIPILIRVRSWRKWIQFSLCSLVPYMITAVSLLIIISVILTLGSNYELNWSPYSLATQSINNWVSSMSQQSGFAPYWVLLLHLIQLSTMMLAIHALMSLWYLFFPKMLYLSFLSFLIFMYAIISFKFFSENSKFILFKYITFPSSFSMYHSFYPGFLIILVIIGCIIWVGPLLKKLRLDLIRKWSSRNYPYLLYVLLCLLGLKSDLLSQGNYGVTVWDNLYLRFYGLSRNGGVSFTPFLYYIIVFIGFVYFHKLRIAEYLSGRFYYTAIRYKGLWYWFTRGAIRISAFILGFLTVLLCLTLLTGFISGLELSPVITVLQKLSVKQTIYHFIVNGWLQLANYIALIFIVNWIFRENAYRLSMIAVLIIAMFPAINRGSWLPTGLNAMGQLTGSWGDTLRITVVLFFWLLFQIVLIGYLFRKKKMYFQ